MKHKFLNSYIEQNHRVYNIFGLKIKRRINETWFLIDRMEENQNNIKNEVKSRVINEIRAISEAKSLHSETFKDYKNIHCSKEVVLVATGPSLNKYTPIKGAIHVGVNRAFMYDKITLDYLFMQDYLAVKDYMEASLNYKNKNLKRFYGLLQPELVENWVIPESIALRHGAKRYYARSSWDPKAYISDTDYTYNITSSPLICHGSVVFPAMQFILYTNPKRIYLVGCDCSTNGYFNAPVQFPLDPEWMYMWWEKLKKFALMYYPETEIISVNPVKLKGLFPSISMNEVQ